MEIQFFRYEWQEYATTDRNGELCAQSFSNPKLELRIYCLIRETPKGYWIGYSKDPSSWKKWIPKTSSFAYPTKDAAMKNFTERTTRRVKILRRQVECCNIALKLAESM